MLRPWTLVFVLRILRVGRADSDYTPDILRTVGPTLSLFSQTVHYCVVVHTLHLNRLGPTNYLPYCVTYSYRRCLTLVAPSRGAARPGRCRGVHVGGMRRGVKAAIGSAGFGVTGGALALDERAARKSKAGAKQRSCTALSPPVGGDELGAGCGQGLGSGFSPELQGGGVCGDLKQGAESGRGLTEGADT